MNIAILPKDLNKEEIYFLEPIKNIIINNSKFIRIIYSDNLFTLNGIYILLNLSPNFIDNNGLYIYIQNLEKYILEKFSKSRIRINKLSEFFYQNFASNINNEISIEEKTKYILKISGIWEANNNIGLTFKFIKINDILSICRK